LLGRLRHFRSGPTIADPEAAITVVCKSLKFSEDLRRDIFSHFISGGDVTAGGVMQAVTSVAQIQPNGALLCRGDPP
jgi:hypothetical protein